MSRYGIMIKAVFFDFYNTLVRFWPPVEMIQMAVCREVGLTVTLEGVRSGYVLADVYFNSENARLALADRSPESRNEFFANYETIILKGAGIEASAQLASSIWKLTGLIPKNFTLFDDTLPTLVELRKSGYLLGLLSNVNLDLEPLLHELGIQPYIDVSITSKEAGAQKPDPPIFLAALDRLGLQPYEALHVGDQYQSDVLGAKGVGITPVLLDREGRQEGQMDCVRITGLDQVMVILETLISPNG